MQQNHTALFIDVEKHASDSILGQARPHFIKTIRERLTYRHTYRPPKLHCLNILSDTFAIIRGQAFQPSRTGSPPASVR
jgi:hypothetical protein